MVFHNLDSDFTDDDYASVNTQMNAVGVELLAVVDEPLAGSYPERILGDAVEALVSGRVAGIRFVQFVLNTAKTHPYRYCSKILFAS